MHILLWKQIQWVSALVAAAVIMGTGAEDSQKGIDAAFMEEVRSSLTNQWEVLQSIRLMIHNNKRGLVRIVKEMKELKKSVEEQGEHCNKTTHLASQFLTDVQSSIRNSAPPPPDYGPEDLNLQQEMTRVSQEMKKLTEAFDDLDQNNYLTDHGTFPRSTTENFSYSNNSDGQCSVPFEELEEDVCIMVVTAKLTWTQADNYC
ncbi:unnamed protein product, partial [Meganyctiphanes norvegica]